MIKYTFFQLTFLLFTLNCLAQLTPEQRIQDSVIGWWDRNAPDYGAYSKDDEVKPATDPIQKKRIEQLDKIVEWMKKTYTPVAGLGTYDRLPNKTAYSVRFYVWNVSYDKTYLDAKGRFKPVSEENRQFYVGLNALIGTYSISFLNKTGEHFFVWPPDGFNAPGNTGKDERPVGIHPNVSKYITRRNDWQSIYMAPGNILPFVPVTRGELLQTTDEALNVQWTKANESDKKAIDRIRKNILQLKEKYKNSLNDAALIRDMQPSMYSFDTDPFNLSELAVKTYQYFPVYKIPADVLVKCKGVQPQWVSIAVPFFTQKDGNQLYEMYQAVTENFNYEYVYNYFFAPEKVKNVPYKPANEEQLIARLNKYRKTNAEALSAKPNLAALPAGVHFADDFSSNEEGADPANWYFRKIGTHATIVSVKGQTGKWLKLGYNVPVSPTLLRKPLPENFTLEYDIVTDGDFSSRTGGAVNLILNSNSPNADGTEREGGGTRVLIKAISGNESDFDNNNYSGVLSTAINSSQSSNEENNSEGIFHNYQMREFTNRKNRVHITIKISGTSLALFVNNRLVAKSANFKLKYGGACKSCGLPTGTTFNAIYWNNITNEADKTGVYIGNVKITKN